MPKLWQFTPTKRFDADGFAGFLALLPDKQDGLPLAHVVDVRHESLRDPAFVALCRKAGVSIVHTDSPDHPAIGDASGPVSYARLMDAREEEPTGYASAEIDCGVDVACDWAKGETPDAFPLAAPGEAVAAMPCDVFVLYIDGEGQSTPCRDGDDRSAG